MTVRRIRLGPLSLICCLTLWTFSGAARLHAEAVAGFGETVEVELVNVETWVTDADDRPVEGLPKDAFRVFEDGEEMNVVFFSEVRPEPATDGNRAEPATPPSAEGATAGSAQAPRTGAGHLILYLDQLHLTARGQDQIVKDLKDLVDSGIVEPESILVLRQDQSLYIEAPFGSSRAQVDHALDRLSEREPFGAAVELERNASLQYLQERWQIALETAGRSPVGGIGGQEPACDEFIRYATQAVATQAERGRQRISTTLDHLYGIAGFLSALEGSKSLLYASDSLEINPGSGLYAFVDSLCPGHQAGNSDIRTTGNLDQPFYRLARDAAASRVTFYGIQAGGLRANLALNADQGSIDLRGAQRFQSTLRTAERAGLLYLSAETGGRAIYNQNDLSRELLKVAEELNAYYSLAYSPADRGTGHEHKVKVRLSEAFERKGFHLRHRRGYLHKSPATRLRERLDAVLFLGLGENSLAVRLGLGDPTPQTNASDTRDARLSVPLHVYVPVSSVTFVPSGDGTIAQIFVQIAARDGDGERSDLASRVWKIEGPADQDGVLDLRFDLQLGPGLRTVGVAVRDELSRETSFVSTTLAVPEPGPVVSELH